MNSPRRQTLAKIAFCLIGLCGCRESTAAELSSPPAAGFGSLPVAGAAPIEAPAIEPALPSFCARAEDSVRDVFCSGTRPEIHSLSDLQVLLDVNPGPPGVAPIVSDPYSMAKFFMVVGHSTALSGHLVSPINPRLIVNGRNTLIAYQRGVQRIELATRKPEGQGFTFYLVTFEQACNARAAGCSPGDLFTPEVETNWTRYDIRDDEDLKNSPLDCRQCHQRGRDSGMLLMRELQSPWTHFFEPLPTTDNGASLPGVRGYDLMRDYLAAKGDELYGGTDITTMPRTSALILQTIVDPMQPLVFDSRRIEDERWPYGESGYPSTPNASPWWNDSYAAFKRGEQLALPYFDPRSTDPDKQARLTDAYRKYRSGELRADELPDLADIFPDDPLVRAQIGLQTEPDSAPADALIAACGGCHNDVLDQTISRARFNVDLSRMDRGELDVAIARISLPRTAAGAMPPPEARQLHEATRARLVEYLALDAGGRGFEPRLQRAATVGMTGGTLPYNRGSAY